MKKEFIDHIAHEICAVLRYYPAYLMSWGVLKIEPATFREMAGVSFTVNGFLHKGTVFVVYNEEVDLYEVYCLNEKTDAVKCCEDVYCDMLADAIDSMVEKNCPDEAYSNRIKNWFNGGSGK